MRLPNLSNMVYVGQLRHIQSTYEPLEHRNPDGLIRHLLTGAELWGCRLRGRLALDRLRRNPFYYYVLARTRHYDEVYSSAIADGVRHILNIGSGSDTRAYRYADQLCGAQINCIEFDQKAAISAKERVARRKLPTAHVQYMPLDLNVADWTAVESWLDARSTEQALVMMEGVSPYVEASAFGEFLRLLSSHLAPGSRVSYDFKLKGVADGFGQVKGIRVPFRLPDAAAAVADFHARQGYRVDRFELGSQLMARMAPGAIRPGRPVFSEDALVQLTVVQPGQR